MPFRMMNTIKYEYEDSNPNSPYGGDFFPYDPIFTNNFDAYFPAGFDLTEQGQHQQQSHAFEHNPDDENDPFWDASLEDVLSNFSPSDINLELLTDDLLPLPSASSSIESENQYTNLRQSQNHFNNDLTSNDFFYGQQQKQQQQRIYKSNNLNDTPLSDYANDPNNWQLNKNLPNSQHHFHADHHQHQRENDIYKHPADQLFLDECQPSTSTFFEQQNERQQHQQIKDENAEKNGLLYSHYNNLKDEHSLKHEHETNEMQIISKNSHQNSFGINEMTAILMDEIENDNDDDEIAEEEDEGANNDDADVDEDDDMESKDVREENIIEYDNDVSNNKENKISITTKHNNNKKQQEQQRPRKNSVNNNNNGNGGNGSGTTVDEQSRRDYAKRIEEPQMAGGYVKPSYSYSCLITLALKNSHSGELTVSEIYAFLCEHFPYFCAAPSGWKNSVRHNLSLNKSFQKIEVETPGCHGRKSCLWRLNPNKTIKMEQELRKWRDRSESLIISAMRRPSAIELDAIQSGRMGMPAGVRRRTATASSSLTTKIGGSAVASITANSSGYSSTTTDSAGSPYAGLSKHMAYSKQAYPHQTSHQFANNHHHQHHYQHHHHHHSQHQPRVIRRIIDGADFEDFHMSSPTRTTSSSSSSSCSSSLNRRSSPSTARLPLRLSGNLSDGNSGNGSADASDPLNVAAGTESYHKAAARKLDFLLQQKSLTIFNPSKELFASPPRVTPPSAHKATTMLATNNLTAERNPHDYASPPPPAKRALLSRNNNISGLNSATPTRSPLSSLISNAELKDGVKQRRQDPIVNSAPSALNTAYSLSSNYGDTKSNAENISSGGSVGGGVKSPLSSRRVEKADNINCNSSARKELNYDSSNGVTRQRQKPPLRNYQFKTLPTVENDENAPPPPSYDNDNIKDYNSGNIIGGGNTNSTVLLAQQQQQQQQQRQYRGAARPYQISLATTNFKLSETSNLSPSRKSLIKERQQHFMLLQQQQQMLQQQQRKDTVAVPTTSASRPQTIVVEKGVERTIKCQKDGRPIEERSMSPFAYSSTFDTVTDAINNNSLL